MSKEVLGFTAGNFDLLHPGYIKCFREAKRHCDRFIVFLQRDPSLHIKFFKPDIRILGEDYITKESFTGDDLPPEIIYTTRSHGWSTTKLKDLITAQTVKQNPETYKKI